MSKALPENEIICGDALEVMKGWPDKSIHCCVTSPPYWGQRDYGVEGQIGLEKTLEEYVAKIVEVFRQVKRVLRDDGALWLNLGDSYASGKGTCYNPGGGTGSFHAVAKETGAHPLDRGNKSTLAISGLKPKDLCGIPWRVALALQADGWYLRQDIIWSKPNPMPESCTDRCTKAHEYIFLLTKRPRYFYDQQAIAEPCVESNAARPRMGQGPNTQYNQKRSARDSFKRTGSTREQAIPGQSVGTHRPNRKESEYSLETKNKRSVWTVNPQAFPEAHFATFPEKLIEPCILAGTSQKGCCPECGGPWERIGKVSYEKAGRGTVGGRGRFRANDNSGFSGKPNATKHFETTGWRPTCEHRNEEFKVAYEPIPCVVFDPFMGSGTVAVVAIKHGRSYIGIELKPEYVKMAETRIKGANTGLTVKELQKGQGALFP